MNRKAFTLVELAIVLTVVGLVAGGSFKVIKSMRDRNKITEAKDAVNVAKDATIGFSMKWVDLPTSTEFNNDLSPIKRNQNTFFYFADPQLSNDIDICSFNTTELDVTIYESGSLDRTIDDVAFIVADASINNNMQTAATGTGPYIIRIDDPLATVDRNNIDYVRTTDEYDDIVKWVTLAELQSLVNCSDHQLVITNDNALPRDINQSTYVGANIFADGGFPFPDGSDVGSNDDYEWCMESPSGIWANFYCGTATFSSETDCSSATYHQCTSPTIIGTTGNAGTYNFNMYVRDRTSTIKKNFTITIDRSN